MCVERPRTRGLYSKLQFSAWESFSFYIKSIIVDGTIKTSVTECYKSFVTSCSVAFKKFKGQVRRERHQATTNQKTVFANNWKMFFRERPFCVYVVIGKGLRRKQKRWFSKQNVAKNTPSVSDQNSRQTRVQILWKKNLCSRNASTFASRHESGVVLDRLASWKVSLKCNSSLLRTAFASVFHLLIILNTFRFFFSSIQLIGTDYSTQNCECRIKDVACLGWCVVNSSHA